jgi:hypothetical protein
MYLITLLKSGVRLLVEILITACKLMSVKEHLYLLLLIFKQEKLLGSRRIYLTVLTGHNKLIAGRYLLTPALSLAQLKIMVVIRVEDILVQRTTKSNP